MIDAPEAQSIHDLCSQQWHIVGRQSNVTMEWEYCLGWRGARRPFGVVTVQQRKPWGYELLAKLPGR